MAVLPMTVYLFSLSFEDEPFRDTDSTLVDPSRHCLGSQVLNLAADERGEARIEDCNEYKFLWYIQVYSSGSI